jgi:hypothetical protein
LTNVSVVKHVIYFGTEGVYKKYAQVILVEFN